jgi:hypothetical protein
VQVGQVDGKDQLSRPEHRVEIRPRARLAVQILDAEAAPVAIGREHRDGGAEGDERDGEVARVVGDAVRARAQDGQVPREPAVERRAAAARFALVAARGGVAEIRTPRPLEQVAPDRRGIADLRAGGLLERLRHRGPARADRGMGRDLCHGRERADAGAGLRREDRAVLGTQVEDLHQPRGCGHVEPHEVHQIGASREVLRAGPGAEAPGGVGGVGRAFEAEGAHRRGSRAMAAEPASTASTMSG